MTARDLPTARGSRSIPWWTGLAAGIPAIIIGVLLILSPQTTATYLFLILGAVCIAGGAAALISILFNRKSWGWKLLASILAIFVGVGLISQPLFSAYLLAAISLWILGASVLLVGVGLMVPAFSHIGWWYGLIGVFAMGIGALLILGSVIGPLRAPWVFGVAAILAGILGVMVAVRAKNRPQGGAITVSPS